MIKHFSTPAAILLFLQFSAYATPLPEVIVPQKEWEYHIHEEFSQPTDYHNSLYSVKIESCMTKNDTIFITTSEHLYDTSVVINEVQNDTAYTIADSSWQFNYILVPQINGPDTGYLIEQINANNQVITAGSNNTIGYLPVIFPDVTFGDSIQFPISIGDDSYRVPSPGNCIYHHAVGLIYSSVYYFVGGGGSTTRIISYCDSIIDIMNIFNQLDSLESAVIPSARVHHRQNHSMVPPATCHYDLLGRRYPIDRIKYRATTPLIGLIEERKRVFINPRISQ